MAIMVAHVDAMSRGRVAEHRVRECLHPSLCVTNAIPTNHTIWAHERQHRRPVIGHHGRTSCRILLPHLLNPEIRPDITHHDDAPSKRAAGLGCATSWRFSSRWHVTGRPAANLLALFTIDRGQGSARRVTELTLRVIDWASYGEASSPCPIPVP